MRNDDIKSLGQSYSSDFIFRAFSPRNEAYILTYVLNPQSRCNVMGLSRLPTTSCINPICLKIIVLVIDVPIVTGQRADNFLEKLASMMYIYATILFNKRVTNTYGLWLSAYQTQIYWENANLLKVDKHLLCMLNGLQTNCLINKRYDLEDPLKFQNYKFRIGFTIKIKFIRSTCISRNQFKCGKRPLSRNLCPGMIETNVGITQQIVQYKGDLSKSSREMYNCCSLLI